MPKFSVFVTGVCGFMEKFKRVVLVNATQPSLFTVNAFRQEVIPPHYAFLRFQEDQVGSISEVTPLKHTWVVPPPIPHASITLDTDVLFLDHHQVITPAATQTTFNAIETPIDEYGVPEEYDDSSLEWVLKMSQLLPGSEIPNPLYLTDEPGESVSAFTTFAVGDVQNAFATRFQFMGANAATMGIVGKLNRGVSQMVRYDLMVEDPIVIQCRLFGDEEKRKKRRAFAVTLKSGLTEPWMLLGLSALDDILQLSTVDSGEGKPDFHSRLLYRMSKTFFGDADVVLPQAEPREPEAEIGFPRCLPAQFT